MSLKILQNKILLKVCGYIVGFISAFFKSEWDFSPEVLQHLELNVNSFKMTFRLLNHLNPFANFMKHVHNKIEEQILNTCKLPENPTICKWQEENAPFFFFQASTVICFLFQRKKALINVSMSFEESCCSKTIQQCFLGSMSRVGATVLLLVLAQKSELF